MVLAVAGFAACSKDEEKKSPVAPPEPNAPYILYWDAASGTLAAGQWKRGDDGEVNDNNVLLFKFGSVVGFTAVGSNDTWNAGDVKFNPTGTSYPNYADIPRYDGDEEEDGYISSNEYHNATNVKLGLGDPCRLVGLPANATTEEIADHDSGLRLPVFDELCDMYQNEDDPFVWTYVPRNGRWLTSNPTMETFLPSLNERNEFGESAGSDLSYSRYWTGSMRVNTDEDLIALQLFFSSTVVSPGLHGDMRYGLAIRCVED